MDVTEAEDINKKWQEYVEELYRKELHQDCYFTNYSFILLVFLPYRYDILRYPVTELFLSRASSSFFEPFPTNPKSHNSFFLTPSYWDSQQFCMESILFCYDE